MKGASYRNKKHVTPFSVIMFAILFCYAALLCFLLFWVLMSSFKSKADFNFHPLNWPEKFIFSNYKNVLEQLYVPLTIPGVGTKRLYLLQLFGNSLIYAVGATVISILTHAMVAYVVAKYRFFLRNAIYTVAVLVMIIPIVNSLPSELAIMRKIGFYDNILGLILMKGSFTGINFLILHATFSGISWEYAEAARMDGASNAKIMFRIMFPMASTTMTILALTSFIGFWNDWTSTMVYMPSYPTAAYALYNFQNSNINIIATGGVPYVLCACGIVMLPILAVFILFRNRLMGEFAVGGIKG